MREKNIMGDRANIHVKDNDDDPGVYLYTHWGGTELPATLQKALAKKWRWYDSQYLARIIFDEMTDGSHGEETGFGISAYLGDGDSRVLEVNCGHGRVTCNDNSWTFQEYTEISEGELSKLTWEHGQ